MTGCTQSWHRAEPDGPRHPGGIHVPVGLLRCHGVARHSQSSSAPIKVQGCGQMAAMVRTHCSYLLFQSFTQRVCVGSLPRCGLRNGVVLLLGLGAVGSLQAFNSTTGKRLFHTLIFPPPCFTVTSMPCHSPSCSSPQIHFFYVLCVYVYLELCIWDQVSLSISQGAKLIAFRLILIQLIQFLQSA